MTSLDSVRQLAASNAALANCAQQSHQAILAAATKECTRLTNLIAAAKPAVLLMDETKATQYQQWVMQRAGLMQLLSDSDGGGDEPHGSVVTPD